MKPPNRTRLALAALIATALLAPPPASASPAPAASTTADKAPQKTKQRVRTLSRDGRFRRGLTLQLGLGVGYQTGEVTGAQLSELAVGGLDFGAGTFIDPWTAFLFRGSLTLSIPDDDFFDRISLTGVYGFSVQHFVADWLKLEAGAGLATHWVRTLERLDKAPDFGVGLLGGVYVPFFQHDQHALELGVTYTPIYVRDALFHAGTVVLIWQYL